MLDVLRGSLVHPRRKAPVDVVVTVGYSDEGGTPRCKDRFFIVRPMATRKVVRGGKTGAARDFAPGFEKWNEKGNRGLPQITGVLHHQRIEDALSTSLTAQTGPVRGQTPPGQRPWCSSDDGQMRARWTGAAFETAVCPAEACPHLASTMCKPFAHFTFTLNMDGYPEVKAYWENHSWNTLRNLRTWVDEVEREWATMLRANGLPPSPVWWHGMPIRMQVGEVTKPRKNGEWGRWPEAQVTTAVPLDRYFSDLLTRREAMAERLGRMAPPPTAAQIGEQLAPEGRTLMTGGRLLTDAPLVLSDADTCPTCAALMAWDGAQMVCSDPRCGGGDADR